MRLAALLTLAVAHGQSIPGSFVVTGAAWYQNTNKSAGWLSYGARFGQSNTYSYSTLEMSRFTSVTRTGVAQVLWRVGEVTILALGDAGVQTSTGTLNKALSLGGVVALDLSKHFLKAPVSLVFVMRSTGDGRIYQVGVGRTF